MTPDTNSPAAAPAQSDTTAAAREFAEIEGTIETPPEPVPDAAELLKNLTNKSDDPAFPPTPLEAALSPETPTVRKKVHDSAWLESMPDFNPETCRPTETDCMRAAQCMILGERMTVEVAVLDGKMKVGVRLLTNEEIDYLYAYLRTSFVAGQEFFSELQLATAAMQVVFVNGQKFSLVDVAEDFEQLLDEIRLRDASKLPEFNTPENLTAFVKRSRATLKNIHDRVREFRKMNHLRWAAILTAVRMANVRFRMISELIVKKDPLFTSPEA